jgi:hypothetical protein
VLRLLGGQDLERAQIHLHDPCGFASAMAARRRKVALHRPSQPRPRRRAVHRRPERCDIAGAQAVNDGFAEHERRHCQGPDADDAPGRAYPAFLFVRRCRSSRLRQTSLTHEVRAPTPAGPLASISRNDERRDPIRRNPFKRGPG